MKSGRSVIYAMSKKSYDPQGYSHLDEDELVSLLDPFLVSHFVTDQPGK